MRNKPFRRYQNLKEFKRRLERCLNTKNYKITDLEYIKHKRDILHSLGSNYWNSYETKSIKNKRQRLVLKKELKNEITRNT